MGGGGCVQRVVEGKRKNQEGKKARIHVVKGEWGDLNERRVTEGRQTTPRHRTHAQKKKTRMKGKIHEG